MRGIETWHGACIKESIMNAIKCLTALALAFASHVAHAAPQSAAVQLSQIQQEYCHNYAETEYQAAVSRGDGLPDGAYEQAQADCEFQWRIVEAEWASR